MAQPDIYIDESAEDHDPRAYLKGIDPDTDLAVFQRVKAREVDWAGRLGASVTSSTEITIGIGEHTFAVDADPTRFKEGDDVEIISIDPDNLDHHLVGTLLLKGGDSFDPTLTLLINDVPDASIGVVIRAWELSVWMRPKVWLEVDISDTGSPGLDPTSAGPFTLTVTAGKLFDLPGGTVQLRSIEKPQITILTHIRAYSGTSLVLEKVATNATVSETLSAWDVFLIDAPPPGIPLAGLSGLQVELVVTEKVVDPGTLPTDNARGIAISPDGLTLVVAHQTTPFVTIYRRTAVGADDWTKIANPATLPPGIAQGCGFSPDGLTLAVAHAGTPFVTIYRRTAVGADDWTKIANPAALPAGDAGNAKFSPDGLTLAVAHATTPFVTIYRRTAAGADDWTKVTNPAALPASSGLDAAFSPDGLTLAVAHNTSPRITIYRRTTVGADDWVKVADPAALPAGDGRGVAFSPDGLTLAIAHTTTPFITVYRRTAVGADDWAKVADPATLPPGNGNGVAVSPDGLILAVAHGTTPFVTIYRRGSTAADDWTKITNPATLPAEAGFDAAFSPDGLTLAVAHDASPRVTIYRNPDAGTLIYVNRGTVRSYDDSVDIENSAAGTYRVHRLYDNGGLMLQPTLAGTGTSAGTALTGTGTAFLAAFGSGTAQAFLADYDDQITGILRDKSVITAGAKSSGVASVSTDTALVTVTALLATAAALKRGGYSMESGTIYLGFGVAFKDTDGSTTRFITALTGSGVPDLPAGHTRYRIVAILKLVNGEVTQVLQPLTGQSVPDADEIDQSNSRFGPKVQDALDTIASEMLSVLGSGSFSGATSVTLDIPPGGVGPPRRLVLSNLVVATDAAEIFLRLNLGAGVLSGAADYGWTHLDETITAGGGEVATTDLSDSEIELMLNVGNLASEGGEVEIIFPNPAATAKLNGCKWSGHFTNATPVYVDLRGKGLVRSAAGAFTQAQILTNGGNISGDYEWIG